MRRTLILLLALFGLTVFALPLDKNDLEEVNFEFNSVVLVDGFPSMLQLADVLNRHPELFLFVEGHCDYVGGQDYNDKLALKRAEAVRDFLVKYGARLEQIEVSGKGKNDPRSENETPEGRFMNRRVVFSLYKIVDGQKVPVKSESSISGILTELDNQGKVDKLDELAKKQDAILDKLAGLDTILASMKSLEEKNAKLEAELAAMKDQMKAPEVPPTPPEKLAYVEEKAPEKPKDFSLLGFDIGATEDGDLTGSASARWFHRFTDSFGIQTEGQYVMYPERQEFQFDLGFVYRYKMIQAGAFSSLKRIEMDLYPDGGTLAQGSLVAEYLFPQGSIGGFATHGLLRESVVNREMIGNNIVRETYLRNIDQYGIMWQLGLPAEFMVEGNVGYMNRGDAASKAGGVVRIVRPLGDNWSWFVEGGWNETLIGDEGTGRFAGGLRYGKWKHPTRGETAEVEPVEVPRIKYDVRTRLVREGNDAPVANAGPDQHLVDPGTIHLDGTASHDADGDPITYEWTQHQGPPVTLIGADTATPYFEGAVFGAIYVFRLKVTDPYGAYSVDDVVVAIRPRKEVKIDYFLSDPAVIPLGGESRLLWKTTNATNVEIAGIGTVPVEGNTFVNPTETAVYTMTAYGEDNQVVHATATVTVAEVIIEYFTADAMNITPGQSTTLRWKVANADSVDINGESVSDEGSLSVSPTVTTTYTLSAHKGGVVVTSSLTVTVADVVIDYFVAEPAVIGLGDTSRLSWKVRNADSVTISGLGSQDPEGSAIVNPTSTTTYTLTAKRGSLPAVTATVTVTVEPVEIEYFVADPAHIALGQHSTLTWKVVNADSVTINNGIGTVQLTGSTEVAPTVTTTYTLTATKGGTTVTAQQTVVVSDVAIQFFVAEPAAIGLGQQSTLSWKVVNADSVTINNGIGAVNVSEGTTVVSPTETTTYTMTAKKGAQQVTAQVMVSVQPVKIEFFIAEPLAIALGEQSTLSWKVYNAETVTITGIGAVDATGTTVVAPTETTTYTLTASRGSYQTTATVTVTVEPVKIEFFIAEPTAITLGEQSRLSWRVINAEPNGVTISGIGVVDNEGSTYVAPLATTQYTLTAKRGTAEVIAQVTVQVTPAKIEFFVASPEVIGLGESSRLSWKVTSADSVSIEGYGTVQDEGELVVTPPVTTTYKLIAVGRGVTVSQTVTVTVNAVEIISFEASPNTIDRDGQATLKWNVINASSVTLQGATVSPTGELVVSPLETTTYTLVAQGPGGPVTKDVIVTVNPVRIEYFIADPSEISLGDTARLRWKVINADSVEISSIGFVQQFEGETVVNPTVTTTYTLTATRNGQIVTATVVITVINVRIAYFTADPDTIGLGESSTLSWKVENADSVEIVGIGAVQAEGSVAVSPTETTIYTLIASGGGQQVTATVTVHIAVAEILYFNVEPAEIKPGAQARLSWEVVNADSVEITGVGPVSLAGNTYVSPTEDTTYTLTAMQGTQVVTATVTVTIAKVRILYFTAEPLEIPAGASTLLRWAVVDATSISFNPDLGVPANQFEGSMVVSPTDTTTYILTAEGAGGPITASVTVTVGLNRPPVAYAGPDTATTINTTIALEGFAEDPDGDPITILWTIVDQPTGSNVTMSSTSIAQPTFRADLPGFYALRIQVTDSKGATGEDTVQIRVWPTP